MIKLENEGSKMANLKDKLKRKLSRKKNKDVNKDASMTAADQSMEVGYKP